MNRPTTIGRVVRGAFFSAVAVAATAVAANGCLDRPVGPATPLVSARVVALAKQNKVNKIDLLFMIDNSSSMADKQNILSLAVPELVDRLIEPKCVDPISLRTIGPAENGVCTKGGELDFEPIKDIHIGIVTSSLGNHGAPGVCDDANDASGGRADPHNNDQGRLVSRGPGGVAVTTHQNKGFLFYNPAMGGLGSAAAVAGPFTDMVKGVGQHGCGYEASLEAVYRFLVDPEPYRTINIDRAIGGFGQAVPTGTDTELLQQRADFLRSDSLVSIMIVTDENDCSVVDGGQGFYAILSPTPGTGRSVLWGGTSACKANPYDRCCFNCKSTAPGSGCQDPKTDPACTGELASVDDAPNLRCFEQKRRYGQDFLYPVQRYIDGFTKPLVPNRKGDMMVPNPLFADLLCKSDCKPGVRDKGLVFVAGIVGVPWQDIANDATDLQKGYKTAKQIADEGIWDVIVGDPQPSSGGAPVPPSDIHMVESILPRAGLPGPSAGPTADNKNGHEWDPSKDTAQPKADLQYACIFQLDPPKVCASSTDCDCFGADIANVQNPLCQNAAGAYSTTQSRAKAYPGTRILQVLRGIDPAQAIVSSICPANVTDISKDDFGYSPAIRALVGRLRNALRGQCLPRTLEVDLADGPLKENVPCVVVEVFKDTSGKCECPPQFGRTPADTEVITDDMRDAGNCFCEIKQLAGEPQRQCKTNLNPDAHVNEQAWNGWCYVDPTQGPTGEFEPAQCAVVRSCPATDKRLIKFINTNSEPRAGATAFIMCQEQSFPSSGGGAAQGTCN